MFSDTHCHFSHIASRGIAVREVLADMERDGYRAALDIGTRAGDLGARMETLIVAGNGVLPEFVHFACGIWPDADSIANQDEVLALLESDIQTMITHARSRASAGKTAFAALGECGVDRYWNGTGVSHDDVSVDGPGTDDLAGEESLFSRQIELARTYQLPVIVHSREAFDVTRSILRNMDYHRGVIHCYSYGIPEAREFLDMGWYISFPGNITQAEEPFTGTVFGYMVVIAADSLCHDRRADDGNPVSLYRAAGRNQAVLDRHGRLQFTTMGIECLQKNILGTHMCAKPSDFVYQDVMSILSFFQIARNAFANFLYVRVVPERYRVAHDCIHRLPE